MAKVIQVPDLGGTQEAEVIEILVAPGDEIKKDDSLITLESDKASMEVPSPMAGKIEKIIVAIGDKVSTGSVILELASSEEKTEAPAEKAKATTEQPKAPTEQEKILSVPDIGNATQVEVIEVNVKSGDVINKDDSLITLESDKASMEVPATLSGKVLDVKVKVGDKVNQGDAILTLLTSDEEKVSPPKEKPVQQQEAPVAKAPQKESAPLPSVNRSISEVHAGPAVRRLAREFGVDLTKVPATGPKNRILKEDVQAYVKAALASKSQGGFALPKAPEIDFSVFGEIESKPLSKIKRLTGVNVHRSWITVPHVTQFDEADITAMENFRKNNKDKAEEQGFKLTPLVFIMKAVVAALKEFPSFNASLDASGENLIYKKYYNLGVAADTPNGLVVPVIRQVDQKGILELAKELAEVSQKAREKGLSIQEMSGSCFTISSLGGIGGTAFTPIINTPDVAILGVSKASMKPVYQDGKFEPRLMLPLSLSYDHRVIDGAEAARFSNAIASCLGDIRRLLL